MSNAIRVISPYRFEGTWVFDDPNVDLVREPFVCGIPEMIDALLGESISKADRFRLLFSDQPFPGYQWELRHVRGDMDGNWYRLMDPPMEGWLCPALFKYFSDAPMSIYLTVEPINVASY